MILLDKPYVSDFLKDTIEKYEIPVVETDFAKEILEERNIKFISQNKVVESFKQNGETLFYTNSENSISWVENNLAFSYLPSKIRLFKDKIRFRELLKPIFPDYFFTKVDFATIDEFDISNCQFPFIIKPAVGFFSIGVYRVDSAAEWQDTIQNIKQEIHQTRNDYPIEVVNTSEFIIEQIIEGEEYAIDCYFDTEGQPVVLGIMHHVFSSGKDVSDRIYSTSKDIINSLQAKVIDFMQIIGNRADLRKFPLHIEIRIDADGKIMPIEVNPLRFGGWCTTADAAWFAYGFNPYEYFFFNKKPDWDEILKDKDDYIYSLVLLDNNSGVAPEKIASYNYEKFLSDFQNPLHLRKINFNEFPIFGFLFTETNKNNTEELTNILHSDLKKYLIMK